jgi:hypothetical protein
MADEIFEIGPLVRNIDFYIGSLFTRATLSASANLYAQPRKITKAKATLSGSASLSANPREIVKAKATTTASLNVSVRGMELLKVLALLNGNANLTASPKKISKARIITSGSLNRNFSPRKIAKARGTISTQAVVTAYARRVKNAKPNLMSINLTTTERAKEVLFAHVNLNVKSKIIFNPPIRFSPAGIDQTSIRSFLILDGKPLTNHNRKFDDSISGVYIENTNWHNQKSRYYKRTGRKTFNLTWSFLPNYMEKTVDQKHGRDYIKNISDDPDIHVLKIINQDESGTIVYTQDTYNVFIKSYDETLVRRDLVDNVYYFDCSMSLEEA